MLGSKHISDEHFRSGGAWADVDDSDLLETSLMLPPETRSVDENGDITITSYRRNEDREVIQEVRKVRMVRKRVRKAKEAIARAKRLSKFGDCEGLPSGPNKEITYLSYERIPFERVRRPGEDMQDEEIEERMNLNDELYTRIRGMIHETQKSRRDRAQHLKRQLHQLSTGSTGAAPSMGRDADDDEEKTMAGALGGGSGAYRPPVSRGSGTTMRLPTIITDPDEAPTLRINNLSEEATEDDVKRLFDLWRPWRCRVARDKTTGDSRGFAFVTFRSKDSAEQARKTLDGHPYDHLILSVEWGMSKAERDRDTARRMGERMGRPGGAPNIRPMGGFR